MTVKLTGAQWNQFVHEPWPDSWWIDDEQISVNGVPTSDPAGIRDTDVITVTGGYITKSEKSEQGYETLEAYLRKWLKKQTQASLSVSCPKDKVKEVTAAIVAAGGKVK